MAKKELNLVLHCGAKKAERQQVEECETPQGTDKWRPIPHNSLITMLTKQLPAYGLKVVNEAHGLYKEGLRYFGMFQVEKEEQEPEDDFSMVFGVRNSHDKSFAAGLCLGSGVFVCDNLAFSAEVTLGRRHTRHILRDLPLLTDKAIGQLMSIRNQESQRFESYKNLGIDDKTAAKILLDGMTRQAINTTRVPKVWDQWNNPKHEEFAEDKNLWRLFNAFTEVYKETSVIELPARSQILHGLLDAACGFTPKRVDEAIEEIAKEAEEEGIIDADFEVR